jgi:drug/metabolite transporter (DMT)-like permease
MLPLDSTPSDAVGGPPTAADGEAAPAPVVRGSALAGSVEAAEPPPRLLSAALALRWWHASSDNLRASIIILVAIVSFTAMTILFKVAGERIPLVEILTIRQLVMQILITPFTLRDFPGVLRTHHPVLQVTRGLLQLGAMVLTFAAIIALPLALSTMISFSYALFVTIGAGVFLKEKVGVDRWLATLIGFVGVAVMLRPSAGASLGYSFLAVIGAVFAAASAVSLRVVPGAERADTILTYQALVLLAALAVPTALVWVTPTFEETIILLLVGVTGTIGQWLLTVAYKTGEAAALAPLDFVRLLLTVLGGFVLFGESLDLWEIAGGLILIGAAAYTFRANAGPRT